MLNYFADPRNHEMHGFSKGPRTRDVVYLLANLRDQHLPGRRDQTIPMLACSTNERCSSFEWRLLGGEDTAKAARSQRNRKWSLKRDSSVENLDRDVSRKAGRAFSLIFTDSGRSREAVTTESRTGKSGTGGQAARNHDGPSINDPAAGLRPGITIFDVLTLDQASCLPAISYLFT